MITLKILYRNTNIFQKATKKILFYMQKYNSSISKCYNSNRVISEEVCFILSCRVVLLECLKFELAGGKCP